MVLSPGLHGKQQTVYCTSFALPRPNLPFVINQLLIEGIAGGPCVSRSDAVPVEGRAREGRAVEAVDRPDAAVAPPTREGDQPKHGTCVPLSFVFGPIVICFICLFGYMCCLRGFFPFRGGYVVLSCVKCLPEHAARRGGDFACAHS